MDRLRGEGYKTGRLDIGKVVRLEDWKTGRPEGWKIGILKCCRASCLEGKAGSLDGGKAGMFDGGKVGKLECLTGWRLYRRGKWKYWQEEFCRTWSLKSSLLHFKEIFLNQHLMQNIYWKRDKSTNTRNYIPPRPFVDLLGLNGNVPGLFAIRGVLLQI